jgi:hypothetical protein
MNRHNIGHPIVHVSQAESKEIMHLVKSLN